MPGLKPLLTDSDGKPLIMAGPCSAESREMVLETAQALALAGVKVFRAGVWKPRTKPGGFEGVGSVALPWLREVTDVTGMLAATEVATAGHVHEALDAGISILWIGARTSANPFAVQEIADAIASCGRDVAVMVKNPLGPDVDLWLGAIERIYQAGVRRLAAIHRGFTAFGPSPYRNIPLWHVPLQLSVRVPNLPVLHDPSHTAGRRDLVADLCREALDLGFHGLFVECHCNPDIALSDARQQLTPAQFCDILNGLPRRTSKPVLPNRLEELRNRIDVIDSELLEVLARRMETSREIGDYKRTNSMSILQSERFNDIIADRIKRGESLGMSGHFLEAVMTAIHDESVAQQLCVLRKRLDETTN